MAASSPSSSCVAYSCLSPNETAAHSPRPPPLHHRHRLAAPSSLSSLSSGRSRALFWLSQNSETQVYPLPLSRNGRASVSPSALPVSPSEELPSQILSGAALFGILGFGALRAFVYFRIQYIIASMLGRYVPKGGSRVLDLDIHEGRNLYYYPADVEEVVALTDKKNLQVVKNQAIRAGVPVIAKVKEINSLRLPSNSIDAVVSVYSLSFAKEDDAGQLLREAIRLLKPGKPLIFVENITADSQIVRTWQLLVENIQKLFGIEIPPSKDIQKLLEEVKGLEKLECERVFEFQDPHVVGVAMKQAEVSESTTRRKRSAKSTR